MGNPGLSACVRRRPRCRQFATPYVDSWPSRSNTEGQLRCCSSGRLLAAAAVGQPAGSGRTRSRRGCRRYRRPRQRLLRGDQFDAANAPYRVVQRRPVVCDQGQRCVVERSFESAPTAMDRMAAVGRHPLGGQGRPKAAGGERLLLLQLRATCSARPISQRELHRGPPRSRCIHVSRYADSVEQPDASRLHIPSDFRSVVRRERTLENGQLG